MVLMGVRLIRFCLLFFCVLLLVGGLCHAQDGDDDIFSPETKVFDGRLVMGGNITQVDGDTYGGFHNVGLNMGGMVYVHLSQSIGVSMELLYARKGARGAHVKESVFVGTYFDKYYLNLNYVEVPLVFHLKRWYVFDYELGVAYARLISSREWGAADVPVQILPEFHYFNNTDISLLGGVTLRLHKHWYGNVRFQYSLVPIRPWARVPERYNMIADQYNNVVSFRVLYRL